MRRCRVGGVSRCAAGVPGSPVWGLGVPGGLGRGPSFGFCRGLVDEVGREGGVVG